MDVSRKAEDVYPIGASGPCSQFLVESVLLICFCYFVCMILITSCSLLCTSVLHAWSLLLDYILFITAITLVPLIILSQAKNGGLNLREIKVSYQNIISQFKEGERVPPLHSGSTTV